MTRLSFDLIFILCKEKKLVKNRLDKHNKNLQKRLGGKTRYKNNKLKKNIG